MLTVPVIRRVGGLEVEAELARRNMAVIRRVGGLEVKEPWMHLYLYVIRRVGGLEVHQSPHPLPLKVIRRVGGLEVSGRTPSHFIGITPFRGQLPTTPKEKRRPTSK